MVGKGELGAAARAGSTSPAVRPTGYQGKGWMCHTNVTQMHFFCLVFRRSDRGRTLASASTFPPGEIIGKWLAGPFTWQTIASPGRSSGNRRISGENGSPLRDNP